MQKLKYYDRNKTHCDMLVLSLKKLSDFYLDEFNRIQVSGIYPSKYLNKRDALREIQYLCEWCKIQQFELSNEPAQNW